MFGDEKKKPEGFEMAESVIEEVLKDNGILDEDKIKLAKAKIMAGFMVGLMMETFKMKGDK